MNVLLNRRTLLVGLLPKKITMNTDTLEKGQQISRTFKTNNFEMLVIVREENGCVLTSEQYSWYDPIEKEEKFKMNNQLFICEENEI